MAKNYSKSLCRFNEQNIISNLKEGEPKVRYWFNLTSPKDGILCALDEDSKSTWWDQDCHSIDSVGGYNESRCNNLVEVDLELAEAICKLLD